MTETAHQTPDLKELFRDSATYWQRRTKEINAIADDIEQTLSDRLDTARRESLKRKREILGDAVQTLLERVKSPELVLATTGTTSSGKSTLANFLIGDSLLPSAVQEMSAGLVKVSHHDYRHTLKIAPTRGATWDTGEWDNLSADDVRQRLENTMEAFREVEKEDSSIEPVQFEIDWPIRLASEKLRFGLPEGTQITILDLPGLKAINDERNGPVIRKNISQALCLVAYNAEETDDKKQKELLNQVINQVTSWRKTSAVLGRMLFLLNRIDAFSRNDSNPNASLAKFRSYVTKQLREGLLKELPEEQTTINEIEPAAISSLPALWAVEANLTQSEPKKQQDCLESIEANFSTIFPKGYWKSYPRDFEELTDDSRRHLIDDTLRYSFANEFEQRLGKHIAVNLPEIALAGPISTVANAANDFLTALDQTLDAYTTRTEDEAKNAKKRLEKIEDSLIRETENIIKNLEKLKKCAVDNSENSGVDIIEDIGPALNEIGNYIGKPQLLAPIRNLSTDIFTRPSNDLSDFVEATLQASSPAPSPLMMGAPTLEKFINAVEKLQASPYGKVWQEGGIFREGPEATMVQTALDEFSKQLSVILNFVVAHATNHSGERISIIFKECVSLFIAEIEKRTHDALKHDLQAFPGLSTIFDGEIVFPSFKSVPINFLPKIEEWNGVETREEKEISYERSLWTLYLMRHKVEKIVKKDYDVKGIAIYGIGDLFSGFYKSNEYKPLEECVWDYITTLIEVFTKSTKTRIEKGIESYKLAIDQSIYDIDKKQQEEVKNFKLYKNKLCTLLNAATCAPEWKQITMMESADVI